MTEIYLYLGYLYKNGDRGRFREGVYTSKRLTRKLRSIRGWRKYGPEQRKGDVLYISLEGPSLLLQTYRFLIIKRPAGFARGVRLTFSIPRADTVEGRNFHPYKRPA